MLTSVFKNKKDETNEILLSIINKKNTDAIHNSLDITENQKTNGVVLEYVNAVDVLQNKASS